MKVFLIVMSLFTFNLSASAQDPVVNCERDAYEGWRGERFYSRWTKFVVEVRPINRSSQYRVAVGLIDYNTDGLLNVESEWVATKEIQGASIIFRNVNGKGLDDLVVTRESKSRDSRRNASLNFRDYTYECWVDDSPRQTDLF